MKLTPDQQAIWGKRFHSSMFVQFPKEDLERAVPERFEKLVRLYPDRIAIKTEREVVTYWQLNVMANRMAHAILDRRGAEAQAVAILLDKGARLAAAMLAVLKAGKFFVLLDSSYPKARFATVLKDCQADLIISERKYGAVTRHLPGTDSALLDVDAIPSRVAHENLGLDIAPNALAAINYTSGSTGEPKGVIWAHRNLLHQVMLFTNAYKVSDSDRLLLATSGTGNAVTIEFLALLNGARLLPFDVQMHGVNRLINWLRDEKISICWIGSPLFRNICYALASEEKFLDVRILRLASEASYKSDIELYKQHFSPECQLINGLSNTEAGLICLYPIDTATEITGQDVPVGYPVEDKEVFLLDDSGNEVGFHAVGEIAIRSRYLSPGYWHRPELTATKFKPDPDGGDRLIYLSGDLGVRLPDGCLIHKGRKDFRVKIRGYGVEVAEIEKVLNTHAAVRQAVVMACDKQPGQTQLVAYYTRTELAIPTVSELRSFLRNKLPDFMIPAAFVMMEALPLTQSGKIDRHALPYPDNLRPDLDTAYLTPRNEIEQQLVAIWEDVLSVRPVGVTDRFFDLGGDSLSAGRVIAQVIKLFQLEIPLQLLFQSPTIGDLALEIGRRQGKLSGDDHQGHVAGSPVPRVSRQGLLPLSYSQQRLWFLDQLYPGGFTYNLFSAYRLKGELNVPALERSLNEIIKRHEVLRTVFKSAGGSPTQVVLPNLTMTIPIYDLRGIISESNRWTEIRRISKAEAQRRFSLAIGPLLWVMLVQLADDEYILLRAMHHIVSDGWSEGVLFQELFEIYAAISTGKPSPLADLPIQYADYAVWQRQWFVGERLESQLSYWRKTLENIESLHLPTDRPRRGIESACGARQYFTLSRALSSELKALSNRHGATLFMTLLAAFQTLLHRYSGQTDIVVGSPVAGRSRRELEGLIGFFINTLVLRVDLSGNPTFAEAIRRVREASLGALSHQELPFEKLVEELHPERSLGRHPLFQVSFAFQNTPRFSPRLPAVKIDELEVETGNARFDLHLFLEEVEGNLKGYCDYDTELFDADTIARLLGHFQAVLDSIAENPNQHVTAIPMLTKAEKHRLLVDWNDTETDYPKDKCIHELFEAQVERTPDAIAVVFEDRQLTYRELNNQANQLAHHLLKFGVAPGVLVGIRVERSIQMIVGLLGILKAGGAYVPLDLDYPKERVEFILNDSQVSVLLTNGFDEKSGSSMAVGESRSVTVDPRVKVIHFDRDRPVIEQQSRENLGAHIQPNDIAYVIYTSGSTGTPKGVVIEHRNTGAFLSWAKSAFTQDDLSVVLASTSICFDLSVFEIFAPLWNGGTVIVVQNALALTTSLTKSTITLLNTVPSVMNELLDPVAIPGSVRVINLAGEPLRMDLVRRIYDSTAVGKIHDLYGPTECTTYSTWALRTRDGSQTIGRPIANTQIYVLDPYLAPVPIGVAGEIYIGGDGVARGYWNRPELTSEKFLANPFSVDSTRRLYKTGDLARYLPDGNIEFLGRIDNQVKLRGFRIELGEIESVLGRHPSVSETVVLGREDSPGDKRLVAYVVASDGQAQTDDLRDFLKQKLPEYMVPFAFVFLDTLPLTANGKLDRKVLPAPDQCRAGVDQIYAAPRTQVEELLANIWGGVLKLDKVGIHDNLFDLGGHSLLATQIMSRVRDAFHMELPLRMIFEHPTIASLSLQITQIQKGPCDQEIITDPMVELESLSAQEVEQRTVQDSLSVVKKT